LTVTAKPQPVRYPTITTNANAATQLLSRSVGTSNQYQWSPPIGLNLTSVINPVFNYDKTTQYLITIVSDGCSVTDTLLVKVLPVTTAAIAEDIFVPTAWSPNNDGHNDKLIPFTKNIQALNYFKVFNRWGELVFQTNTIGQGWDGVYKNKPQVMDTYTWTAEVVGNSGKIIKRSGNSVLLR
jgi:gliding motility-associated-like protein